MVVYFSIIIYTAISSKIISKEQISNVNDINLMLSASSRESLKNLKVVLPPRLLSLLRHSLAGLSEDTQEFVCGNVITYLRSGFVFKSGVEHVDQRMGLLVIELMNAKASIHFPPF